MRIGVFDSGLGGINVLSCLIKKYPQNNYLFFGDTINLPYGDKTKEELLSFACQAIDFLLTKNVDIIIIACGTISSTCFNDLKKKYQIPLYDILSPTIQYLTEIDLDNIGVIATKKTIESNIFNIVNKKVIMHATPSFVPIIENGLIKEREKEIIDELQRFSKCSLLVLGCTHYPLLSDLIKKHFSFKIHDLGECLVENLLLENKDSYSCTLYFSLISVRLVENINQILKTKYEILLK